MNAPPKKDSAAGWHRRPSRGTTRLRIAHSKEWDQSPQSDERDPRLPPRNYDEALARWRGRIRWLESEWVQQRYKPGFLAYLIAREVRFAKQFGVEVGK